MSGGAALARADCRSIPLADESVDLIVTSPPYFALRSYQDGGEHFAGQIGSEPTLEDFLVALWAVTAETVPAAGAAAPPWPPRSPWRSSPPFSGPVASVERLPVLRHP